MFYLKDIALERERNREKEIEIFHPLVRSPNACSTQGWAQSEPGALLPPGPHVVAGTQGLSGLLLPSMCISREIDGEWSH